MLTWSVLRSRALHPLLLLLCLLAPACVYGIMPVHGCGIDGIPSMAMNGRLVTINHAQATKESIGYYAPFLLGTATAGADLHFGEDAAKLHKALLAQAFATPFTWSFGDGATARGLSVQHRYRRPGMYKVDVSYYYTPQARWVVFDSAELAIPGAAALPQATSSLGLLGALAAGLCAVLVTGAVVRRRGRAVPQGKPRRTRGTGASHSARPQMRSRSR